jgi:D-3-phosphoglycerate dehydrogenase
MNKVLIAAPCHPVLKERLENAGYFVVDIPAITQTELERCIPEMSGLILSTKIKITSEILQSSPLLKWIGRLGSGLELIDMKAAESIGIKVYSSPEGNRDAVGEHALGMLLGVMHNISLSYLQVRDRKWIRDANRGTELGGKTVGIIGFGNAGQAFASLLKGFNVKILAHDKYVSDFGNEYVKESSLDSLLRNCDVVSLHLPLNKETHHFANVSFFNKLEKTPVFINTSRGSVHHTEALIDALKTGRISGACLDVLENENLSSYSLYEQKEIEYLLENPRVLITPHIAGYSTESFIKMSSILADKLGI